jgi:hypothetical protein
MALPWLPWRTAAAGEVLEGERLLLVLTAPVRERKGDECSGGGAEEGKEAKARVGLQEAFILRTLHGGRRI